MAAGKRTMDLTEGNIVRLLIVFAIPIIIGQILQNLYNSFDAIIVGQNLGTEALAAVSSSSDISQLLVGFFTGLSTGSGVLFARYYGAKDYEKLHTSIHTALLLAVFIGVGMAAIGIILAPFLLRIVKCPDDVFGSALTYLRVYLVGILFTAIYNVGAGVLRAVGDTRRPLYFLAISSAFNIFLDLLLVKYVRMGVLGAALATVCSQLLSVCMLGAVMIRSNDVYKLVLKDLRIEKEYAAEVVELGIPAAIQSSLTSISNLFVQRYINNFGKYAMAGIGAAKKIDKFVGLAGQSMGQAITTFVSQNNGAKKYRRAFRGIYHCLALNVAYSVIVAVPLYIFADKFVSIFTHDPEAIFYGVEMMRTMLPLYSFQVLNQIYSGSTRGFGKSRAVMFLSLLGMIGCRQLFLAVSMHLNYDVHNIFIGYPVGWGFSALFVAIYFYSVIYRMYHKRAEEDRS